MFGLLCGTLVTNQKHLVECHGCLKPDAVNSMSKEWRFLKARL